MAEVIYAGDAGIFKVCSKCLCALHTEEFSMDKEKTLGIRHVCRTCDYARVGKRQKENYESQAKHNKAWRQKNKSKSNAITKRWREKYPEYNKLRISTWVKSNPEKIRQYNLNQRSTPQGKIENSLRRRINHTILSGSKFGRKTFDLLGYTAEELKAHLESLFVDGMTWSNHGHTGKCWHIDHIIPLSAHNYETPDDIDFKKAWALSNLQPLWAFDNISKHARLSSPFQPSLALKCG